MAKKFVCITVDGERYENSKGAYANNFPAYEDCTYYLSGKQVSILEFFTEAQRLMQVALEKKMETHKKIRVPDGATGLQYRTIWVRRK